MSDDAAASRAAAAQASRAQWFKQLEAHGAAHGLHAQIGPGYGALYTDDDDTLLVTFEMAPTIRNLRDTALPYGLEPAGKEGWSHLAFYAESDGFFRSAAVFDYIDGLIDDGFFYDFERVVFYGAGPCSYAAAAFSVAAPGATVVLVNPVATLETWAAGWDRRYAAHRRRAFSGRYAYAPRLTEGSEATWVLYDPLTLEDAAHAALFARDGATLLPARHLGSAMERFLDEMGMLTPLLIDAGRGRLTQARAHQLWRNRRASAPYLHRLLTAVERRGDPRRIGLCARAALAQVPEPRFRMVLDEAEGALEAQDETLPTQADHSAPQAAE